MQAKEGNQWRKILLRAHTFLSRFERVSFNFSLISICCFWDSSAARSTRRNKPSVRASLQKDPFQLSPFILFYFFHLFFFLCTCQCPLLCKKELKTTGIKVAAAARATSRRHGRRFLWAEQKGCWTLSASGDRKETLSAAVRGGRLLVVW